MESVEINDVTMNLLKFWQEIMQEEMNEFTDRTNDERYQLTIQDTLLKLALDIQDAPDYAKYLPLLKEYNQGLKQKPAF